MKNANGLAGALPDDLQRLAAVLLTFGDRRFVDTLTGELAAVRAAGLSVRRVMVGTDHAPTSRRAQA